MMYHPDMFPSLYPFLFVVESLMNILSENKVIKIFSISFLEKLYNPVRLQLQYRQSYIAIHSMKQVLTSVIFLNGIRSMYRYSIWMNINYSNLNHPGHSASLSITKMDNSPLQHEFARLLLFSNAYKVLFSLITIKCYYCSYCLNNSVTKQ